jgi:hypothetical protein
LEIRVSSESLQHNAGHRDVYPSLVGTLQGLVALMTWRKLTSLGLSWTDTGGELSDNTTLLHSSCSNIAFLYFLIGYVIIFIQIFNISPSLLIYR